MSIGLAQVANNVLRRNHYRDGLRTFLLEGTDTNRCPQSENLGLWTKSAGTGTATGGFADPLGGTSAFKLDDQDVGISVNWHSANLLAYGAGPTQRGFSVYVKGDTSGVGDFMVYDVTAAVAKARFTLTNTGGVITAALWNGAGSVVAVLPSTTEPGWYRVLMIATGLTLGNTHQIYLRPADPNNTAATGAMLFWGLMAHETSVPAHSYIQNNSNGSVLSVADALRLPWLVPPAALSLYAKYREIGMQSLAAASVSSTRILQIGDAAGGTQPRLILFHPGSAHFRLQHEVSSAATTFSSTTGTPTLAYGDQVEAFGFVYADGSAQVGVSINGAAPLIGARSAAIGFPGAWSTDGLVSSQLLNFGSFQGGYGEWSVGGAFPGIFTLDELRSLAAH